MRYSLRKLLLGSALIVAPLCAGATTFLQSDAGSEEGFDLAGVFINPDDSGGVASTSQSCEWWMSNCTVYGRRQATSPYGGWWGSGYGMSDGYDTGYQDYGGDSYTPPPSCDQMDYTAEQIATYIQNQITLPYGPVDPGSFDMNRPDRRFAEFISFLDHTQTSELTSYVVPGGIRFTPPWDQLDGSTQGFIHNHPEWVRTEHGWIQMADELRLLNRYPSGGDWATLQEIATRYGPTTGNYDPSIYLVDSYGTMREFKLSDRQFFSAMSDGEQINGAGLDERTRQTPCPTG